MPSDIPSVIMRTSYTKTVARKQLLLRTPSKVQCRKPVTHPYIVVWRLNTRMFPLTIRWMREEKLTARKLEFLFMAKSTNPRGKRPV